MFAPPLSLSWNNTLGSFMVPSCSLQGWFPTLKKTASPQSLSAYSIYSLNFLETKPALFHNFISLGILTVGSQSEFINHHQPSTSNKAIKLDTNRRPENRFKQFCRMFLWCFSLPGLRLHVWDHLLATRSCLDGCRGCFGTKPQASLFFYGTAWYLLGGCFHCMNVYIYIYL